MASLSAALALCTAAPGFARELSPAGERRLEAIGEVLRAAGIAPRPTGFSREEYATLARFVEERCADGLEHLAYYAPERRLLIDASKESAPSTVGTDWEKLEPLRKETRLLEGHCHRLDVETYARQASLDPHERAFVQADPQRVEARMFSHTPSPGPEDGKGPGDIGSMLHQKIIWFLREPRSTLGHLVLVMGGHGPSRMLSYDLSPAAARELRSLVGAKIACMAQAPEEASCAAQEKKVDAFEERVRRAYYDEWQRLAQGTCDPETVERCVEPDFAAFYRRVNAATDVRIEDLGPLPGK